MQMHRAIQLINGLKKGKLAMPKDLRIEIEAKLAVSDETAEACVTLLNMYFKENAPELLIEENKETGVVQIGIRNNKATTEQ